RRGHRHFRAGSAVIRCTVVMLLIDGSSLTLDVIGAVARGGQADISLAHAARDRIDRARAVVDRKAAGSEAVYGINTGFGSFAEVRIEPDALDRLPANLLR